MDVALRFKELVILLDEIVEELDLSAKSIESAENDVE